MKLIKEESEVHVFTQVDPNRVSNYELLTGDEIYFDTIDKGGDGIIIGGNNHYNSMGDKTLIDVISGSFHDDELGYDYDVFDELKKITGKEYDSSTIRGSLPCTTAEVFTPLALRISLICAQESSAEKLKEENPIFAYSSIAFVLLTLSPIPP